MPGRPSDLERLSPLQRALFALQEMRARLTALQRAKTEPLAIVGLACRFPGGAADPEAFWRLLRAGRDAITEVPRSRWDVDFFYDPNPDAPGTMYTRWGGFVDAVDRFDAGFFGISPREAAGMDPQQRLLAEVSWEALEDAGQAADQLAGSRTGVFFGISASDYLRLQTVFADRSRIDAYSGTGTAASVAGGRLSHLLGLRGPSLAVDTACSSSLVSLHLASQSLRGGECDLALAGGVNVILSPDATIYFCRLGALAADGRCKSFDAAADGYVRAEGCGVVVLKRLADALADRDDIRALVLGSAVNHDGRSSGLTVPSGPAQQAVIREALANARVEPGDIGYVETHGSGTPLGDAIEIGALAAALGAGRAADAPLAIGSVKTNLGHLEGAAGIAGLIKTILVLQHGEIPPHLHLRQPSAQLSQAESITVPVAPTPWPSTANARRAGVSSFGFSGTNAHVILEEAPQAPFTDGGGASAGLMRAFLLPLSARCPEALTALARAYRDLLTEDRPHLEDICYTASLRRAHHDHRLALAAGSREELGEQLDAFLRGEVRPGLAQGRCPAGGRKLVFVFSGQGSQWAGMGRQLLAAEPSFRDSFAECERALRPHLDGSLMELLTAAEAAAAPRAADGVPLLFALQVSLAALWRRWGIEPDAVVGHSAGEIAAAHVAGALTLEDAACVAGRRGRLLRRAGGQGALATVGLGAPEVQEALAGYRNRVWIAATNSPCSTVLSGDPAALAELLAAFASRQVFCRLVNVDIASHSPMMEEVAGELCAALQDLAPRAARVPIYSTVSGGAYDGRGLDAAYWMENLRRPVRFAETVERLVAGGHDIFLELSPHPNLVAAIQESLRHLKREGAALPSLRRDAPEQREMLGSLGALYALGRVPDWRALYPSGGRCVRLPSYPWQRRRHWFKGPRVVAPVLDALAPPDADDAEHDEMEEWLYEPRWPARPRADQGAAPAAPGDGTWLLFVDGRGVGEALAARWAAGSGRPVLACPGRAFEREGRLRFRLRPDRPEDLRRLLGEVAAEEGPGLQGIVHLWSLDAPEPGEEAPAAALATARTLGCASVLHLVQALLEAAAAGGPPPPRLWLVTQGAQAVEGVARRPLAVAQAPLWGFGRALAEEHSALWGGMVDLDAAASAEEGADQLAREIADAEGEDQIAFRLGQRHVARLERRTAAAPTVRLSWRTAASYLITGGLGELGLEVARWLVGQGARRLILLGRTELPPRAAWTGLPTGSRAARQAAAVRALEALGASVHLAAVDVSDEAQLASFLAAFAAEGWPPIRGVVHAAGQVEPRSLAELDAAGLERMMRAKALGAWLLHRQLGGADLDFFVLFSSAAALLGSPLLAGYAAANGFVDALAHHRRSQGLPALSVNWGFWGGLGMANRGDERRTHLQPLGMASFSASQGLAILDRLLRWQAVQTAVLPVDWRAWSAAHPAASRSPLLADLVGDGARAPLPAPEEGGSLDRAVFLAAAPEERLRLLEAHLAGHAARVLRLAPGSLDVQRPLNELGIDSLMAFELKNRIEASLGVPLPVVRVLEGPSVAGLAGLLLAPVASAAAPPPRARETEGALERRSFAAILAVPPGHARGTEGSAGEPSLHPLSAGQCALWFLYRLAPESAAYNILYAARTAPGIDVPALRRGFAALVGRHPQLRTTYGTRDGKLVQTEHARQDLDFEVVDATAWSGARLRERLLAEADRPFALELGPVLRVRLFARGPHGCVLLLAVHHIALDFWSLELLLGELRRLYAAETTGAEPGLAPLALRFTDYVRWQSEMLAGPEGERLWAYWREQLRGDLPMLQLPCDRPRPPVQRYRGATHDFALGEELGRRLAALAAAAGTTLYATFLAAFQLLLYRYSGQSEILVGSPVAGRSRAELEGIVGFFVNPVVLRADLSGDPGLPTFLARTRRTVLGALAHQDYPFSRLVERLQPVRAADRSPLFQVSFVWDKTRQAAGLAAPAAAPVTAPPVPPLALEPMILAQRGAPFDLVLTVVEAGGALAAGWQYSTDLFDPATIARAARHLVALLTAIAAAPAARLSELSVLTAPERHQLLHEWSGRVAGEPVAEPFFAARFEAQAERTPDAAAVVWGPGGLTYRELNVQANRLAHRLVALGVGPEVLVGLCVPRSPPLLVGILGILKAGGAYLPLDGEHPPERLAFMVADSRARVLLTVEGLADRLPEDGVRRICLDARQDAASGAGDRNPALEVSGDQPAYVIYTSGSTGMPKGVTITHRGLANYLRWCTQAYPVAHGRGAPVHSSIAFDLTVTSLLAPLLVGGSVVLLPEGRDLEALATALRTAGGFSFVKLTPTHLDVLARRLAPGEAAGGTAALIVGGEALRGDRLAFWREHAPRTRLFNEYGPTEAVVGCSVFEVPAGDLPAEAVPIGRPIPGASLYLLDAHLEPVPRGVSGEIYVGGAGIARGYLGRPALTAESFLPDPFGGEPGARLYKTGDLARWLPDGNLEYLGRCDDQVKIRGCRVEPEEVAATLAGHPAVRQAVVVAREEAGGERRLVAYVVVGREPAPSVGELRGFLQRKLPDFMVPQAFVWLDAMPLSGAGKVDRRALPAPDRTRQRLAAAAVAPRTPVEARLAAIWSEVLGVDEVGVEDNFFDLGGASIQSLEVVELAREAGLRLTPEGIFEHQTIAELAAAAIPAGPEPSPPAEPGDAAVPPLPAEPPPSALPSDRPAAAPAPSTGEPPKTVIESLGVYLPPQTLTTDEVLRGCRRRMAFPLERMTGIRSRHITAEKEFSIDLARKAIAECLAGSARGPHEIELLICCNISRCDGPSRFSFEPCTAVKLRRHFGFDNAVAFDISNACAGVFTAIAIVDSLLALGEIRCGMVASGEYISHLTHTAQKELRGFMDPRLACLTVGDAGVAMILERRSGGAGFHDLELYTLGRYSSLCVARATTEKHGGAIMLTDSIRQTALAVKESVAHCAQVMQRCGWHEDSFQHLIMHQTSITALRDAVRHTNHLFRKSICHDGNTIYNLAERGNTATTSHFLAVWDNIRNHRIQSGDRVVFGITGSGQTIGTALYAFDDLPDRLRGAARSSPFRGPSAGNGSGPAAASAPRIQIESVGVVAADRKVERSAVELAAIAAEDCVGRSGHPRSDIGLLLHAGVYREGFMSEPAVAAMIAGRLRLNDGGPATDGDGNGKRTLAFDVFNGAVGFLNACQIATVMMRRGRFKASLVVTAEIENNAGLRGARLRGLRETGAALLLAASAGGRAGFGRFVFKYLTARLDALVSDARMAGESPYLHVEEDPEILEHYLESVPAAVGELLAMERLEPSRLKAVFPPQISPRFISRLSARLGIARERFVDVSREGEDLFTASLPHALRRAGEEGRIEPGDVGLLISVGSGLQVGCATYYF